MRPMKNIKLVVGRQYSTLDSWKGALALPYSSKETKEESESVEALSKLMDDEQFPDFYDEVLGG